jgi:glutathione synthase/RimK-type ligase-like ATP-grasp enzyme
MSDLYYVTDAPDVVRSGLSPQVISAHEYIAGTVNDLTPGAKIINACLDRSYLSVGYYVGLLADARGHLLESKHDAINLSQLRTRAPAVRRRRAERPMLGVLHSAGEPFSPSSHQALNDFQDCASSLGVDVGLLSKDQLCDLPLFDGLFIRDFTAPTNASFYFATRAARLGMPVIDDPSSILRCANKVFINELCLQHGVATPKTLIVMPNVDFNFIAKRLGVPFVLKLPDGAFSLHVHKVDSRAEGERLIHQLRRKSAILCAQEFTPTEFDWRVATLNGRAIFVCKYFMADDHWQINRHHDGGYIEGKGCTIPLKEAPKALLGFAEQVSALVGNGLYGVDIKEYRGSYRLIEVNDNPNIDDLEVSIAEDAVWNKIAEFFSQKIHSQASRQSTYLAAEIA